MEEQRSILIIYTGGTIGMMLNPETGVLDPFNFHQIENEVPELRKLGHKLSAIQFDPPLDSSNINPDIWVQLAVLINDNYDFYDGFVILHGTDTMAYTASALSFMLENLQKPVIFTGSQLPIGMLRTDGKDNLITSIEIAAARRNGFPMVPEVCIYFENSLFRGNRTTKNSAENFNAFKSFNYPPLAQTGIHIKYNLSVIHYPEEKLPLKIHTHLVKEIAILKIFPGMKENVVDAFLGIKGLRAMIIETFGAGNAPNYEWFTSKISQAVKKGIVVVNVTQCNSGIVDMGKYQTGLELFKAGVISGYDITTEAAITKLMFLLGRGYSYGEIVENMNESLRGEISLTDIV
ncbi:MAG TPA: asparaginase [Bacteroidales bacterium]|nr:asparaginase [Bacteroidales bacterium]